MSLKQRASALRPIFSGGVSFVKWIPSTIASALNKNNFSGNPKSSTAQSSPAPTTTFSFVGSDFVSFAMSSNSFISFWRVEQNHEVRRVEQAVRGDWREQVVRGFVKPRQRKREREQGQKIRGVEMDRREQRADAKPREARMAKLFDERKKHAAKNKFLRDRHEDDRKNAEINFQPQRFCARDERHRRLVFHRPADFFQKKDRRALKFQRDGQNHNCKDDRPKQRAEQV